MGKHVTAKRFVAIYMQQGGVIDDVATATGVKPNSVKKRVIKLRKAGVRLPVQRVGRGYNVNELNNIIKEYKRVK